MFSQASKGLFGKTFANAVRLLFHNYQIIHLYTNYFYILKHLCDDYVIEVCLICVSFEKCIVAKTKKTEIKHFGLRESYEKDTLTISDESSEFHIFKPGPIKYKFLIRRSASHSIR